MNSLRILSLGLAAIAAALGQTTIAPSNVATVPAGGIIAVIDQQGKFAFAKIDAATLQLTLDTITGAYTLRAIVPPAPPNTITERLIVVKPTDPAQTTITLPSNPQGQSLMVTRNGQVLSPGEDYTLTGLTLSFVTQHRPSPGQVFQLRYRE